MHQEAIIFELDNERWKLNCNFFTFCFSAYSGDWMDGLFSLLQTPNNYHTSTFSFGLHWPLTKPKVSLVLISIGTNTALVGVTILWHWRRTKTQKYRSQQKHPLVTSCFHFNLPADEFRRDCRVHFVGGLRWALIDVQQSTELLGWVLESLQTAAILGLEYSVRSDWRHWQCVMIGRSGNRWDYYYHYLLLSPGIEQLFKCVDTFQ